MKNSFKLIITASLLLVVAVVANAKLIMPPYMQAVAEDGAIVMVETNSKTPVKVAYGKADDALADTASTSFYRATTASPTTYVHRVRLENLDMKSEYDYKVLIDSDLNTGGRFKTALPPSTSFRFAIMGDCRSNPKVLEKVAKDMAKSKPFLSVYSGDICYDRSYKSFKNEFFIPAHNELILDVPFYNAVGNHEDWAENTKAFTQSVSEGEENKPFYSFEYGDVFFLILSSETGLSESSEQYKYAVEALENTDRRWKVAAAHIPAYCGGGHGENNTMKRFVSEVLEPGGVDVFVNGHSHFYQRNAVNGITHLICAGGGAPLYTPKDKDYTVASAKKHHYLIADVTPTAIVFTVYDLEGNVIDEFSIQKL